MVLEIQIPVWMALNIFLLIVLVAIVLIMKIRRDAAKEKERLTKKISDRTFEVMQQKWEMERQNRDITMKSKEITDNINYAKRIQAAMLPGQEQIAKHFKQFFILYKPKDVVSGDFYSFIEAGDKCVITVADCTGHGVSGAFMSMTGSALLHRIISERKIIQPSEILNHLNTGIIESLGQNENENNDGMDALIIAVDKKNKTLQYAGANRPLWIIRGEELIEVKPDKLPIGGLHIEQKEFSNREIRLQNNDLLYLFTDGYADQFGGELGKKLMTKKFREILLSIRELSMNKQREFLENHLNKWKDKFEQVDDILVMGIKVE